MQAIYDPEFYLQAFNMAGSLMPRLTAHLFLGGKDGGTGNGTAWRLKMHPELRDGPAYQRSIPWPMPSVMPQAFAQFQPPPGPPPPYQQPLPPAAYPFQQPWGIR